MTNRISVLLCLLTLACGPLVTADESPPELGQVHWLRKLDLAKASSKATGKPILLLFQEIPGCQTCQNYGAGPLSYPLLVEAIEDLFVPLAIHNNSPGEDEVVLKRFDEPAWNNPVVRYLDAAENDLIPRKDRQWTIGQIASRMIEALTAGQHEVPTYLRLVADDHSGEKKKAVVAMHCYWEGEGQLGQLSAVEKTWSGWMQGKEVVEITYDPAIASYEEILMAAKRVKCADHVFAGSESEAQMAKMSVGLEASVIGKSAKVRSAKASDQQYYLGKSLLRHLPLTVLQATRINAALRLEQDPNKFLSPRQLLLLEDVRVIAQNNPERLSDLRYPAEDSDLGSYDQRLRRAISGEAR